MPSAVFTILGDASGVKRALGETVTDARRASATITAQGRVEAAARKQQLSSEGALAREQLRQQGADRRAAAAERGRQDRAAQAVREKGLARETAMAKAAAANATALEKSKTAAAAKESVARIAAASRETTTKMLLSDREAARSEASERQKTAGADREGRRRTQLAEREARENRRRLDQADREDRARQRERAQRLGGALGAVAGGARDFAVGIDGQIQSARGQRAPADRELGNAVRNAGGTRQDVAAARDRVRRFVEQTGMSYERVTAALATGQERGSSLEAGPGRTRDQAIEESLSIVREANAEGADPGQYLAARGRLAAAGFRGDSLRGAMRYALAAAQSGQVEVDQLLQQGLPGATRLIDSRVNALGPGASEAQRQATMLSAWRESVATQEVVAASGGNAGRTSNTLASLQNFMNTPRRQEMALANIRTAAGQVNTRTPEGRARAAALRALYEGDTALYERDPTRRGNAMRLRAGVSPIELASRVAAAAGNAQAGANIFAGGGRHNPQAFLTNMRDLMNVLGGERGRRIQEMMGGQGLTDARVAEHQADVESDDLSKLTRAQEAGANALTDNNDRLVRLSNTINDWKIRHPWLSQGADSGGTAAGGVVNALTGGASTALATKLLGAGAKAGSPGGLIRRGVGAVTGRALPAVQRALGARAPFLGLAGGIATASAAGGIALGSYGSMETARTGVGADGQRVSTGERVARGAAAVGSSIFVIGPLISAIRDMPRLLASELRSQPLTATVSPHDAGLAGAEGGGSRNMPPTP